MPIWQPAPTSGPATAPAPPMITARTNRIDCEKPKVDGVTNVINTLTTDTAAWAERENRINQELHNAGLGKVTAKVIGNDAYLDGEVTNGAERDRAVTIAESVAPVRVRTNMIRIVPASMFGF